MNINIRSSTSGSVQLLHDGFFAAMVALLPVGYSSAGVAASSSCHLQSGDESFGSGSQSHLDRVDLAGWPAVLHDLANCGASDDGEIIALPAVAKLRQIQHRISATLARPSVWGGDEDGGLFVEQHGDHTVLLNITADGRATLASFRGIEPEGPIQHL